MRLWPALVLGLPAVFGLVAWDASLAREERAARRELARVERLVPAAASEGLTVAAITIAYPGRGELIYARAKGTWRCMSAFRAPASPDSIASLVTSFFDARGVVRTEDEAEGATYGLGTPVRVRFHGPGILKDEDRDVLFAFDVGTSLGGTAFVRPVGEPRVFEIDHDPRQLVDWPADAALPPLLDRRVVAGSLSSGISGFERVSVAMSDGRTLELLPRYPGAGPDAWIVSDAAGRRAVLPYRIAGFLNFIVRAPITGLADPRERKALGHNPPRATVTIQPSGEPPVEFAIGRTSEEGAAFVWNRATGTLGQIDGELGRLFVPNATMLTDTSFPNPWEEWLTK